MWAKNWQQYAINLKQEIKNKDKKWFKDPQQNMSK